MGQSVEMISYLNLHYVTLQRIACGYTINLPHLALIVVIPLDKSIC